MSKSITISGNVSRQFKKASAELEPILAYQTVSWIKNVYNFEKQTVKNKTFGVRTIYPMTLYPMPKYSMPIYPMPFYPMSFDTFVQ